MEGTLKKIVIVGGGAAGWMTAAALSKLLRPEDVSLTLVESDEIGIIGVGEATIPDMLQFNLFLGIAEAELMRATQATFKLGIEFVDWSRKGARYFHPFGFHGVDIDGLDFHQYWLRCRANGHAHPIGEYCQTEIVAKQNKFGFPDTRVAGAPASYLRYAYHFDAALYAGFLRQYAETRGVRRVEGKVCEVLRHAESGDLTGVRFGNGQTVAGDFFFDCTGFRSLLLDKTLGVPWVDWRHWLPCDAALAVASEHDGPPRPYTRSTAKPAGWQWNIPTQQRTGNGHIYCSEFMSEDEATSMLLDGPRRASPGHTAPHPFRHRPPPAVLGKELRRHRSVGRISRAPGVDVPLPHPAGHQPLHRAVSRCFAAGDPARRIQPLDAEGFRAGARSARPALLRQRT